jgi:beta-N-acetylhexosaminidase
VSLTVEQALGQKLMLSFTGAEPSVEILALLTRQHVCGLTLYRARNVESPAQVRGLTAALQRAAAASGQPPLLIAADQEGGTLLALAGTTPFPGNLALGAAGSPELARRTGHALGLELAAMGINVDYAPVCDLALNPKNAVVGPRSFGEDPARVADLSAAMVEGLQSAGVAATPKHFPGHGDTADDSHFGTPVSLHDEQRLRDVELLPFRAAVAAGARLVMTAHVALPALNGGIDLPTTLSPAVVRGLLRRDLGFEGVIITDALDMQAINQGSGLVIDTIAAVAAGVDVLLLNVAGTEQQAVYAGLLQATRRTLLSSDENLASAERILDLKAWVSAQAQPALDVVACAEHQALAAEVAARALTLVRDKVQRLPLRLAPGARVAVIVPHPADLTPADTSSYFEPALAQAMQRYHPAVEEFVIALDPSAAEIETLCQQVSGYEVIVAATINASVYPGQAALVNELLERGLPVIAVALRMPYDLLAYPTAPTYLCTYSILDPALQALAAALWGERTCPGHLPVSIPGMYPLGYGLDSAARRADTRADT